MIFTSEQPSLSSKWKQHSEQGCSSCLQERSTIVPEDVTIWEWLFDSSTSPLSQYKLSDLGGFTNAVTKERIGYGLAKEYATKISTALVHKFGLAEGDVVALFSPNTVWYPIAMFATNRVGMRTLFNFHLFGGVSLETLKFRHRWHNLRCFARL
jgi:acyl-CoA synthetase (AMP-forming)/AMP-acid ligase II